MRLRHVYLILFALGTVLPLTQLIPWLSANGLMLGTFFEDMFSTRLSAAFGMDVIISAIAVVAFTSFESDRLKMPADGFVLAIVFSATVLAGVSSGLPLFLYLRQEHLDNL